MRLVSTALIQRTRTLQIIFADGMPKSVREFNLRLPPEIAPLKNEGVSVSNASGRSGWRALGSPAHSTHHRHCYVLPPDASKSLVIDRIWKPTFGSARRGSAARSAISVLVIRNGCPSSLYLMHQSPRCASGNHGFSLIRS